MDKDSIPDETQGDQQDHSPINDSADTVDNDQPLEDETPQFFGDEERDDSDDTPSQATNTDDDTTDNESDVDPELEKWANSQNISLQTENEIKLAKRLRDTQRGLHEKSNEARQLKSKYDEAAQEVAAGDKGVTDSAKLARMEFFMDNPDAKELEGAMFDIAIAAKDAGDTAGFKYFQTPQGWRTLLQIAKAQQAESTNEDSYTAGRADERMKIAKKQQASTGRRNSTNPAPTSGQVTDEQINNMSLAQYEKFRKENPSWNPFKG